MQQGWMFFGIGMTMALLQGGWVRRISPANTAKTATWVNKFFCEINTIIIFKPNFILGSFTYCSIIHLCWTC